MLHLLLVIHNHQPLGNLPEVFRKAWDIAYKPFIDVVRRHPRINWALHVSGPLWEWLDAEEPGYFDILRAEHEAGRLEFLTGGMWEPIQPLIDEHSCLLQFKEMEKYLLDRFGVEPAGSWTTERVWEPFLAGRLSKAGIRYTLLDDSQLRAGLPSPDEHEVWGYYRTEHNGKSVAIFPIDEKLRYLIPFRKAEEVVGHLEERARALPDGAAITYGDDGEKFGLWPKTHKWVYGEGWLDQFFGRLEASTDIVTTHPSKYMQLQPHPRQRVYIPTSSYREMGIWTLYPRRNLAAEQIHKWVESNDELQWVGPPHAAGFFRTFLSRYPESRYMHERAGELLREIVYRDPGIEPSNSPKASPVRRALWHVLRAQCNCAYWHGVFGGLYLNYLRFAVHREILEAERLLAQSPEPLAPVRYVGTRHVEKIRPGSPQPSQTDEVAGPPLLKRKEGGRLVALRPDPESEILIASGLVQWVIDPVTGQIISAGRLDKRVDVIDVLARRFEAYHATMREEGDSSGAASPASIHDMVEVAPRGWREGYGHDRCRRGCFGDRIATSPLSIESLARVDYKIDLDLGRAPWLAEADENAVVLRRADGVWLREKMFEFDNESSSARMKYAVSRTDGEAYRGYLLIEFNVGLLAGDAPDRYHLLQNGHRRLLGDKFELAGVSETTIVDEWTGVRINLTVRGSDWMGVYPVRTLSHSEAGLETMYQGSAMVFRLPIIIPRASAINCEASMTVVANSQ